MILSLDIETVPLPYELREFTKPTMETVKFGNAKIPETRKKIFDKAVEVWESGEKAALSAMTGRVALIGYKVNEYICMEALTSENEIVMLKNFWNMLEKEKHETFIKIAGHNIKKFDLPFLVRRSLILGLSVPSWLTVELFKYSSELFFDTMLFWQLGDQQEMIKLDVLCAALGITVKESPVTGKDFYIWFYRDLPECIKYNKQDVEAVHHLCGKFGIE